MVGRKRKNPTPTEDRISALPDEIIIHVLSFLPVDLAARTSILSNRWRYLWTFSPSFIFQFFRRKFDKSLINRILSKYQTHKLHKFSLLGSFPRDPQLDVKESIDFACSLGVRVIEVGTVDHSRFIELPNSFYENQLLEEVLLSEVNVGSRFHGFPLLTSLALCHSILSDDIVSVILSTCLNLEKLTIDQCYKLKVVNVSGDNLRLRALKFQWLVSSRTGVKLVIDTPNLALLEYKGMLELIELKDVPCLMEIRFYDHHNNRERDFGLIKNLMEKVAHSKVLYAASWFTEYLAHAYGSDGKCTMFRNLETFGWVGTLSSQFNLGNVMAFLGDCPNLEKVVIDLSFFWKSFDGVSRLAGLGSFDHGFRGYQKALDAMDLDRVKIIQVNEFSGHESEMNFLRSLLEKAVVLEFLCVTSKKRCKGGKKVLEVLKQQVFDLLPQASSSDVHICYS